MDAILKDNRKPGVKKMDAPRADLPGAKDPIHGAGDGRHPEGRGRKGASVQYMSRFITSTFFTC